MIAVSYSRFSKNLKNYIDEAAEKSEAILITRKEGRNAVVLSEKAYESLIETIYLTASKPNHDWLMESKRQLEEGIEAGIPSSVEQSQFPNGKVRLLVKQITESDDVPANPAIAIPATPDGRS